MAASAGLSTGRIFGRGGSRDSIRVPAWHGALGLEQIWAGGRCLGGAHRTPRYLSGRWLELRREVVSQDLSLPGSALGQGRSRRRARREVPGGGLGDTGTSSSSPSGLWVALGRGSSHILEKRQHCVGGGEGHVVHWSVSWATEGREGGSRDGGLSGRARAGQVMTLLVAPAVRGPSCHSRYMSREGFYL